MSINRTWDTLRWAIDIPDVRLHELRHSFARDALFGGEHAPRSGRGAFKSGA